MKKLRTVFKNFRYLLEYLAVLSIYHPVRMLPFSALFAIADFAGRIFYLLPFAKKLIIANLKVAFPEKDDCEIRGIAAKSAKNTILTLLEFFWFIGRPELLDKYVDFSEKEREITKKHRENGRGLIWATPHIGNWELAGLKFKHDNDVPFAVVVRPLNNPYLDKIISSGRISEGTRVISAKGAVREMMKALKEGFFMATLIDQNTRAREGGIFVDFFGLPVPASRTPALFARKQNVTVAVGGCMRKGRRYEIFALELPKTSDEYADDKEFVQDILKTTENLIKEYPEQYLWLYKRWLYIPENISEEKKKRYPFYAGVVTPRFYNEKAPKN